MKGIERLPDCYMKSSGSNNFKLLELNRGAADELKSDIQAVRDILDLNKAYGKTLDLYGDMLMQKRGALNDVQYRYMQMTRIGRNMATGDYNSILSAMALMFGSGNIVMDEAEIVEDERPCVVKLTKFPVTVLINAGFTSRQAVQMITTLLPICVTLSADNFEGTFEFADFADEYDASAGFADLEGKIGGHLGLLLGEDFEGSFEFGRYDTEYDASAGFADELGTVGGYLGALVDIGVLPV